MVAGNPIGSVDAKAAIFVFPRTVASDRTEEILAFRLPKIPGRPVDFLPALTADNPFTFMLRDCLAFLGAVLPPTLLSVRFLYPDTLPANKTPLGNHSGIVSPKRVSL